MKKLVRLLKGDHVTKCGFCDIDHPKENGLYIVVSPLQNQPWEIEISKEDMEIFE